CYTLYFIFFNDTATTEIYTLSLHDALPISPPTHWWRIVMPASKPAWTASWRSEEHTSELQSLRHLVCRLLLEKKLRQNVGYSARHPKVGQGGDVQMIVRN